MRVIALLIALLVPAFAQQRRDINKGALNLTSYEEEIVLGRKAAADFERHVVLLEDDVVTAYVRKLAENIAANSDSGFSITIKATASKDLDAFSLAGGSVYINAGVILEADEEAEVASVIADQIGHVAARHATERMARMELLRQANIPLVLADTPAIDSYRQTAEARPTFIKLRS